MEKPKNSTNIIITCLALVLLAASLVGLTLQNAPPAGSEMIHFSIPEGNRLIGTYTSGNLPYGVPLPTLLHSYEVFSSSALTQVKSFASQVFELNNTVSLQTDTTSLRPWLWLGALIGLFGALLSGNAWVNQTRKPSAGPCTHIKIIRLRRFLLGKTLLWFAALPLSAILSALFFLGPLGLPVFNLIYIGFIGSYGLLMLMLYCTKRCPGTVGKLSLPNNGHKTNHNNGKIKGGIWLALLVWLAVLFSAVFFTRSGWFYVIAPNERLIWLALFAPITALGFWISMKEDSMLTAYQVETGKKVRLARITLTMIGLLPFFICTIFMGILGSTSGMIGGLQGLLILALVLLSGSLINRLSDKAWLSALLQAILLYALVLPQGVLFAI